MLFRRGGIVTTAVPSDRACRAWAERCSCVFNSQTLSSTDNVTLEGDELALLTPCTEHEDLGIYSIIHEDLASFTSLRNVQSSNFNGQFLR